MFCIQPALKKSFENLKNQGRRAFSQVVPGEASPPASWPGVVEELAVQEVDELKEEPKPETSKEKPQDLYDPKPDSGDPKAADAKNRASAVSAKTAKSEEGGRHIWQVFQPQPKRLGETDCGVVASSHSKASAATNPAPGGGTRAPPPVAVDPESKIPVAQCRQVVLVPVLPKEPVTANRPGIQNRQCYQQSPA